MNLEDCWVKKYFHQDIINCMMKKRILSIALAVIIVISANAQNTEYLLLRADKAYAALQYESAVRSYEAYHASNKDKQAVIEKIADCYWNLRNYKQADKWYAMIDPVTVSGSENIKRRVAELKAINGAYSEASTLMSSINGFQSRAVGFKNTSNLKRDSADWTIGYLSINTQEYREFSPLMLDKKFVWSSNQPKNYGVRGIMGWDANGYVRQYYVSSVDHLQEILVPKSGHDTSSNAAVKYAKHYAGADVSLRDASYLPSELVKQNKYRIHQPLLLEGFSATQFNIGHATASNKTKKVYTSVNVQGEIKDGAARKIGIVEADYGNDGVTNIHFLNLGSAEENVMHPAIDPNGEFLVFSSDKTGGKGGYDLYVVKKSSDGTWSTATALNAINTNGNEVFSTFAPNGDLYFSTDGMPGLGGLDIYRVSFKNGTTAGKPEHLSYPLNTQHDEFGLYIPSGNETGYFTSDRYGTDDVFSFNYQKVYTPVTGFVINKETGLRNAAVPVVLYESAEGNKVKIDSTVTDRNGNYSFNLARPNRIYEVIAYDHPQMKAMYPQMVNIKTPAVASTIQAPVLFVGQPAIDALPKAPVVEPVLAKAPAPAAIEANKPGLVLDSVYFIIYFDFDKYALTPTSVATLNRAIAFLKSNPDYGFILLGHTDLKGNVDYNIKLSKNRVYAANNYMAAKGIDPKKFKLEYYGKSHPAKSGLTDDDGRLNRRVEFILIKK